MFQRQTCYPSLAAICTSLLRLNALLNRSQKKFFFWVPTRPTTLLIANANSNHLAGETYSEVIADPASAIYAAREASFIVPDSVQNAQRSAYCAQNKL